MEIFFWGVFAGITYTEFDPPRLVRLIVIGVVLLLAGSFLFANRTNKEINLPKE